MNTDQTLLERLQQKDEKAIYEVYRKYFPTVENYIILNSGSSPDADDVFQDAMLILLDKVKNKDFVLSSSVKTFLFAICKNLWLKKLSRATRFTALGDMDWSRKDFITDSEEVEQAEKRWNALPIIFTRITGHCSALLKELFLTGKLPKNYKNEHTLHNQKYKCLQQARKVVEKMNHAVG
jgi:DNA-directed RNA polymerase specialized sigma24 family protein